VSSKIYSHKMIGGVLLIAGTSIGAGMLALPITTGVGGFYYSALFLIAGFLYTLLSLFLLLEANLYVTRLDANIITMAEDLLGPVAQVVAWLSFLLLLYAVAAAYMTGGGSLIDHVIHQLFNIDVSPTVGVLLFSSLFGSLVLFGMGAMDYINRFLMICLLATYFVMVIFVSPHVHVENLDSGKALYLLPAIPVIALSFTGQVILPSIKTYLKGDIRQLVHAFVWGSVITLMFYLLWEFVVIGILPAHGANSLASVGAEARPVAALTLALREKLNITWIAILIGAFSFCALVTSFIGVALSLTDFLADGFQIKKTLNGRLLISAISFIPPVIFALFFPGGFVKALSYAGVFVAILFGILPALMVWKARYIEKRESKFRVPGGKAMPILLFICGFFIIAMQLAATLHWLPAR